jgi:hypothetical protein
MLKTKLAPGAGRLRIAVAGSALLLSMQAAAGPGDKSLAEIDACLADSDTVHVCSSKELSNVVLQCGDESTFFIKYDDLDDTETPFAGLLSPYEGLFSCPEGQVVAVFIKSGSTKYAGLPIEGLPPGSGAMWSPLVCSVEELTCSSPSD